MMGYEEAVQAITERYDCSWAEAEYIYECQLADEIDRRIDEQRDREMEGDG